MNNNFMEVKFKAVSENESFARVCAAAFCLQLNPSLNDITDIKTAVSEAVTNCVVHAYPYKIGDVILRVDIIENMVKITISDNGIGIKDFNKAREPFYTTKRGEERSGMGFSVMESFMDNLELEKNGDRGLRVILTKQIVKKAIAVGEEC